MHAIKWHFLLHTVLMQDHKSESEWRKVHSPCRYLPILPMVLVNGAEGIGTGWSTYIPNYNPRDIVANLRRLLAGEEVVPMQPWYNGFKGTIQEIPSKTAGKSYNVHGTVAQVRASHLLDHSCLFPACSANFL